MAEWNEETSGLVQDKYDADQYFRGREGASMENIGSVGLKEWLWIDFVWNSTVVTVPAIATNFVWRFMNLRGYAVAEEPRAIILDTAWEIGLPVFAIATFYNFCQQVVTNSKSDPLDYVPGRDAENQQPHVDWNQGTLRGPSSAAFNLNQRPSKLGYGGALNRFFSSFEGPRDALALGFKFWMGMLLWTVGYVMVANTHMFYSHPTETQKLGNALGAGFGELFGLLAACEIMKSVEFVHTLKPTASAPTLSLGISTKGFWEGFLWSYIGDSNLSAYLITNDKWFSDNHVWAEVADALALGVGAGAAFSVFGIVTSWAGYLFTQKAAKRMM